MTDLTKLVPAEPPLYLGGCQWKRRANRRRLAEWEAACRDVPPSPEAVKNRRRMIARAATKAIKAAAKPQREGLA